MKITPLLLLACTAATALTAAEVSVVDRPPADLRNAHYPGNRAPLAPSPFSKLPIGAIRPEGWLGKQLAIQAEGFNSHLTEISAFCMREGNAWLGADGRGHGEWEEVPYWLKGFGDLGYLLDHPRIKAETRRWIEAVLASQRADGWFGPLDNLKSPRNRTSMPGEDVQGRPDLWPNSLMMSVLRSNHEHTGDPRIIRHLLKYCDWLIALPEKDYLIHWVDKRRGIEQLKNILWLYNVTGEKRLLGLAEKAHRRTNDWTSGISRHHCVDVAQCFYEPGLYHVLSRNPEHLEAARRNHRAVYDEFGQVPGGMYCGDEQMRPGYTGPRQGIETCAMVEMMNSCEVMLTQVDGDVAWADRCEDVAFNSYPAALTADMRALRYLTAPNMPVSDRLNKRPDIANSGAMFLMNPHAHRCCQHNHSHGWPYFAEHLWLATADDGLCAMFYSASIVSARVGDGRVASFRQRTRYPFSESVELEFLSPEAVKFPLYLRIPGWCANPVLEVNGRPVEVAARPGSYVRLEREWRKGDTATLKLPMRVSLRTWRKNRDCVSVDRGPLTYSLRIAERYAPTDGRDTIRQSKFLDEKANFRDWPAFEIFPESPWNYGLVPEDRIEVAERPWPRDDMPWTHAGAPVVLTASARRIPGWALQKNNLVGRVPQSPVKSEEPVERVELLPMGACRLRISAFPTIGSGADARPHAPADGSGIPAAAPAATRPNVLFFAADDLRTDLGCYGSAEARTPHLDALSRRGVLFERAYCQQAVCNPSRASILSGRRPDTVRVWDLRTHFRQTMPDLITLPQHFRNQGYAAIGIGKVFHKESGAKPPFPFSDPVSWSEPPVFADGPHWRDWVVEGDVSGPKAKGAAVQCLDVPDESYLDGKIATAAVAKLRVLASGSKPFFLAVGFWKPHLPFNAPKRYWDLYSRDRISRPSPDRMPEGAPAIAGHPWNELRGYEGVPREGPLPPAQIAELRHGYLACVSFLDAQVGRVMAELVRLDLARNTVVVFWSDHGFHLGEHNLWGKTTNYELDTRVPLLVAAPGVSREGGRASGLAELLDLYPTLSELCGLPAMPGLEGRSLVPQLREPGGPGGAIAMSQHPHPSYGKATHMGYTLRTERHRYVEWREIATGAVTDREFYDHATDPAETRNRIADPALAAPAGVLGAKVAELVSSGAPWRTGGGGGR